MAHTPLLAVLPVAVVLWTAGFPRAVANSSHAFGDGAASDDFEPYVVAERATGRRAERLMVNALIDGLDGGLELVAVSERQKDDGDRRRRTVEFELNGAEKRVVRVALDRAARVAAVEVRVSPAGFAWQSYPHADELLASLRAGRAVHSLVQEPLAGGSRGARLVGTMRGGRRFVVDLGDFEPVEFACPC